MHQSAYAAPNVCEKTVPLQQKRPHYWGLFYRDANTAGRCNLKSIAHCFPRPLPKLNPNDIARSRPGSALARFKHKKRIRR